MTGLRIPFLFLISDTPLSRRKSTFASLSIGFWLRRLHPHLGYQWGLCMHRHADSISLGRELVCPCVSCGRNPHTCSTSWLPWLILTECVHKFLFLHILAGILLLFVLYLFFFFIIAILTGASWYPVLIDNNNNRVLYVLWVSVVCQLKRWQIPPPFCSHLMTLSIVFLGSHLAVAAFSCAVWILSRESCLCQSLGVRPFFLKCQFQILRSLIHLGLIFVLSQKDWIPV